VAWWSYLLLLHLYDSVSHLLFQYSVAGKLMQSAMVLQMYLDLLNNVRYGFKNGSHLEKKFHAIGIAAICWTIWKTHNKLIFEDKYVTLLLFFYREHKKCTCATFGAHGTYIKLRQFILDPTPSHSPLATLYFFFFLQKHSTPLLPWSVNNGRVWEDVGSKMDGHDLDLIYAPKFYEHLICSFFRCMRVHGKRSQGTNA
jgi:hypothetical protein